MIGRRVTYKDRIRAAYVLDQAVIAGRIRPHVWEALTEFTGTRRLTHSEVRVGIDLIRRTDAALRDLRYTQEDFRRMTTGKL